MATRRIREFLDGHHARYVVISHSPAYSAQQVAASIHIPGRSLAKVVIVRAGGRMVMAVVPATREVDLTRIQELTGLHDVRLAEESDFVDRFEGCELGTVPPFGGVFGVDTYVDLSLSESLHIAFNAGTHTDVIVMDFDEYRQLAKAKLARIAMQPVRERFHVPQI